MVSGVIAQCPLVQLTHPPSRVLTWIANVLSIAAPSLAFPAVMPEEVSGVDIYCVAKHGERDVD